MKVPSAPSGRLMSLDALRGFDMFWILGADALVHALSEVNGSALARFLAGQLTEGEPGTVDRNGRGQPDRQPELDR